MAEIRTGRAGEPSVWSTRDLMVIAAIGVALGVVLVPVIYETMALHATLGPLGMASIWGLYVVPLLVATRIMRRPGAALLTSLLVPLVQLPFGPGGWIMLLLWLPAGLACEAPFFLTRYRSLGLPTVMVAGALASLAFIAHMYLFIGFFDLALGVQVALVAVPLLSGALLGGVPAKLLSGALAKTGVLSGYAVVVADAGAPEVRGRA
jgi:energy-coupling factor transport system permease protein